MESRIKLLGHPVHPMLIAFPLGLLATAVIFDVLFKITNNPNFSITSFWMLTAGILGGLLAAVFGFIDWLAIPKNTRARTVGFWHGLGNLIIVILFAIVWIIRRDAPDYTPETLPFILELIAAGSAVVTAWLGGELVYRLRVAVDEGAHLDAPSSLSGPARQ